MGAAKLELIGERFHRLMVIEKSESNAQGTRWECICDCGNTVTVQGKSLRAGTTKSCGCYKIDGIVARSLKHGQQRINNKTPEYMAWRHMKTRCYNQNVWNYKNYGGRGITVCERWLDSFENFIADMGKRPSILHSLDRYPNINGNYEPSNCRWATKGEQTRGQRTNHWIEYNGERLVLSDWAVRLKTFPSAINQKLKTKSFSEIYNYHQQKNNVKTSIVRK